MNVLPKQSECGGVRQGGWRSWFLRKPNTHENLVRWASLLWSGFFFIDPYYAHARSKWLWFAAFYVFFLALYFGFSLATHRRIAQVLLGLFFVLGFVYFPFNHSAGGVFVYPSVMLPFILKEPRARVAMGTYGAVVGTEIAAIFLEVHLLHLSVNWAENITIYIVGIGLSNFAFSRQQLAGEQLRRANEEIQHLAQTAERERIARDLHDLLGHTLTVIAIKADLANRIFHLDPAMAQREIAEVEQTARKALDEVRTAVTGYRAEGLSTEIAAARRALAAAGVQLTTNVEIFALAPDILQVLCLTLREGVTNVIRHARATACSLELLGTASTESVRMTLSDNGVGLTRDEGNGLRGMRERVRDAGGRVDIRQLQAGGTQLSLTFSPKLQAETSVATVDHALVQA